jgi:hypothetical protein
MNVKTAREVGMLPSRPDPIAEIARRIGKALDPRSPLGPIENLAKKIVRPTQPTRKTR